MNMHLKGSRGFTLIELLFVLAFTGIIVSAAFAFYMANQTTFNNESAKIEAQTNARRALNNVVTALRRADQVALRDSVITGNEVSILIPSSNNPNVKDTYLYKLQNNTNAGYYELIYTKNGANPVKIAEYIYGSEGFSITKETGGLIKLKLKTVVKQSNGRYSIFETENNYRIRIDID